MQNTVSNVRNAGRQGVDAVTGLWRKNNNNGQPAKTNNGKPGFFSGAFTAAANSLTGGAYGKLNQMYQQNRVQNAYQKSQNDNDNKAYVTPYEQKYFDFWIHNIKGDFHINNYGRRIDPNYAGDMAVNMWNQWYGNQTGVDNFNNPDLDLYIKEKISKRVNPKSMSYDNFLRWKWYKKMMSAKNIKKQNGR